MRIAKQQHKQPKKVRRITDHSNNNVPHHLAIATAIISATNIQSPSSLSNVSQRSVHTFSKRFMGVRVDQQTRDKQRKRNDKQREAKEQKEEYTVSFKTREVGSILPQRNAVDDATIKAANLKTRPGAIGLKSAIFTTQHIPVLSFGGAHSTEDHGVTMMSNEQYIKERKNQEETLVWEHEMTKVKNIKRELANTKQREVDQAATLPGFDLTPEQTEKLKEKLINDEENKNNKTTSNKKQKKTPFTYDNGEDNQFIEFQQNDDDNNDDDGDDDDNNDKGHGDNTTPKKQHSETLIERLSQKEDEIVNKIRSRAYQQGTTPFQYCKQHNLIDIMPLLGLRPYKKAAEVSSIDDDTSVNKKIKKQKNKYGDDDDSEESDDRYSTKNKKDKFSNEYDDMSIDDDFDSYGDGAQEIGDFTQYGDKKVKNKTSLKDKMSSPAILIQQHEDINDTGNNGDENYRYSLESFNQLKAKKNIGIRLNPKIFVPRQKTIQNTPNDDSNVNSSIDLHNNMDFTSTSNDINGTTGDSDNKQKNKSITDPSKVYVHRRRPAIPDSTFLELGVNPAIIGKLAAHSVRDPTAIQKLAIPYLIRRYNQRTKKVYAPPTVALQAYTGSGKTLSYALPLLSIVDPNIHNKIPPPNVIAAMRQLQGITSLPNPPPLQADPTPADEVERKIRLIQYNSDQMFSPEGKIKNAQDITDKNDFFAGTFDQHDIDENNIETLLNTRSFIDRITNEVDVFNLTSEQWENFVFAKEKEEQEQRAQRKQQQEQAYEASGGVHDTNKHNGPLPTKIDASIFNARVYSLEAVRLRKKNIIQQQLRQIFPFLSPDVLDPDLPQSTLQSVIIVPTKELALQITKQITEANHTVWQSPHPLNGAHQLYGDKKTFVVPHKGRNPIHVRMATGKVDPILLGSMGVFLHKNLDNSQKAENNNPDGQNASLSNTKTPYNKKMGIDTSTGKMVANEDKYTEEQYSSNARQHPFVEFGKGHKHYRDDQAPYRKELQEREKEQMMRVMRLRERQLQGEKLSQYEENEIILQDDKQTRKKLNQHHDNYDDVDSEQSYEDDGNENYTPFNKDQENEDDDFIDVDQADLDYEDDPEKLLKLNDKELLSRYDSFRGDYFDKNNKKFGKLTPQQQLDLKGRVAQALTRQNEAEEQRLYKRQEFDRQQELMRMGLPVVKMKSVDDGKTDKQRQDATRDRYMKEVSDDLLDQIGGQHGDFVEVVRDKQPHIIVGTPSTITNLIKSGAIQLPSTGLSPNQLKTVIFDEVDHLARNEYSLEHRSLLELLSLPTDQSVFVSASMTRDSARLLTRLSRRQDHFINNQIPQRETVSNLLNLPRPPSHALPDNVSESAYNNAFEYAQAKVEHFNEQVATDDRALSEMILSSPRAKKDRVKALTDKLQNPQEREQLVGKITDTLYKQHFVPVIPDELYQKRLQESIDRGKLSLTSTSDEYGEVLFLSTEDYRVETIGNDVKTDEHALPIPPFIKQYYIAPPQINSEMLKQEEKRQGKKFNKMHYVQSIKDKLALDIICQFKLRPLTLKSDDRKAQRLELTAEAQNALSLNGDSIPTADYRPVNKYEISNDFEVDIINLSNKLQQQDALDNQNGNTKGKKHKSKSQNIAQEVCPGTVLVFFNPRREEDMMDYYRRLSDTGLKVGLYCTKSNRHQKYQVLTKNSKLDVILANDTLSRGIDFKSLSMVINVDTPRSANTFIHRSGRVGRVGGMYRKSAAVVNICDVQPTVFDDSNESSASPAAEFLKDRDDKDVSQQISLPKHSETLQLLKHAEKTGVTVNPWPYVIPYNLNRVYLRSLKAIISQETEKLGIQKHLHRKAATEEYIKSRNIKLHKMGVIQTKSTGLLSDLPDGYGDSAFQAKGGLGSKMSGIAIQKLQNKVGGQLRGGNTKPWIHTDSGKGNNDRTQNRGRGRHIKH